MNSRGVQILAAGFLFFAGAFLQGCNTLKKSEISSSGSAGVTVGDGGEEKEKPSPQKVKDDLIAIANSPASTLPPVSPEAPAPVSPTGSPAPSEAKIFKKESETSLKDVKTLGLDPSRIHIGDIFKGQEGMALRKVVSFSDALFKIDPKVEASLLGKVSSVRPAKVPLTISQGELAALKKKVKSGVSLPTRSVALDFDSTIHSAKIGGLEGVLAKLSTGKIPGLEGHDDVKKLLHYRLEESKRRISVNETLYVVTKVTRSASASASFPGAPLGKSDVEPIKNAVGTMFPQFKSLKAEKQGEKVILSQPGGMTWTFEASPLKVKGGRLKIDPTQAHAF